MRRLMLAGGFAAAVTLAGGAHVAASSSRSVSADRGGVSESEAAERHDDVFKRGSELITPYMRLTDRTAKKPGGAAKDLREGIRLLDEALPPTKSRSTPSTSTTTATVSSCS